MKKILLTFGLIILTGCSLGGDKNPAKTAQPNEFVQSQINVLQKKIDLGELTEDEAQEELKKVLQEKNNLNDGSTKSILKKFEMIDPKTAKLLEERIKKNHPEALAE